MVGPLKRKGRRVAWVAAGIVLAAAPAAAHPLSVSYSRFQLEASGLSATVRLPMDDVDLLLQLDKDLDETVSPAEIEGARPAISAYVLPRVAVRVARLPVPLAVSEMGTWRDATGFPFLEVRLRGETPSTPGSVEIGVKVLTDLYSDHRNLSELSVGAERHQFVFQGGNTWRVPSARSGPWSTIREFTVLGIEHILTGYDHIAFLVGLLIVGRGLRSLVLVVTSFTVAHSITLALAALGLVEPAGKVIEAGIAVSIAYVGAENLVAREVRRRWILTFLFGLVHGFGFAGILREMELERAGLVASLLAFNLGVEVGQVAIVALLWPVLRVAQRSRHRDAVVKGVSAVIVLLGLYWFFERVV